MLGVGPGRGVGVGGGAELVSHTENTQAQGVPKRRHASWTLSMGMKFTAVSLSTHGLVCLYKKKEDV